MDYKEAFEKLVWEMSDGLDNYDESVKVSYLWDKAKELDKEVKSLLFGVGIELPTSTQLLSDCKDRFKDLKANNYKFDYRSYLNGYLDSFSKYTISNKQR